MKNPSQFDTEDDSSIGGNDSEEILSGASDDIVDTALALANKERERQQIQSEVEAFLAAGGQIHLVADDLLADPPKRPQSSYGSQPI